MKSYHAPGKRSVYCLEFGFFRISWALPNILKGLFQLDHGGERFWQALSVIVILAEVSDSHVPPRKERKMISHGLSIIYQLEEYRWQVYPENSATAEFSIYFSPGQVSVLSSVW